MGWCVVVYRPELFQVLGRSLDISIPLQTGIHLSQCLDEGRLDGSIW